MTSTIELTNDNYCDQKPVTIEFTFEEHDLLRELIVRAFDQFDLAVPDICELPEDCETVKRYVMLNDIRERVCDLWGDRFGNAPYEN